MQGTARLGIRSVGTALGVAVLLLMSAGASTASASKWVAEVKFPVTVTGQGGLATFETEKGNKVTCNASASKGTIENEAKASAIVTYEKCELKVVNPIVIAEKCPNVVTKKLALEPLSELNKVAGKTGVISEAAVIAEFVCEGANKVAIKVTGSVICQTGVVNIFTEINELTCKKGAAAGAQEFTEGVDILKKAVKAELKVEAALGVFKINEKASLETIEKVKYTNAVNGAEKVDQTP
jgi:hypothetical protein